METKHKPVLLQPSIRQLAIKQNDIVVDATLGGGGHAKAMLKELAGKGTLIAFDIDREAIERFSEFLRTEGFKQNANYWQKNDLHVYLLHSNFKNLSEELTRIGITQVNAILADLGISSDQLDSVKRGFSFLNNAELDMRMDERLSVKAKDLLNGLYKKELEKLFKKYSELGFSGRLAKEICDFRKIKPLETTLELKSIIQKIVPVRDRNVRHPEARVFMALRMAVNDELNSLSSFLPQAFDLLVKNGRLAVITFHSGEERIVKRLAREKEQNNEALIVVNYEQPDEAEVKANPRSRSAKLRILQKLI